MLSDGRRVQRRLAKQSCLRCGATSHVRPLGIDRVRAAFDEAYSLGATKSEYNVRRAASYAKYILPFFSEAQISRVLDVGCGSGDLLRAIGLACPKADLVGVEAAAQLAPEGESSAVTIIHGFAEDLPAPTKAYDLVCSVNVIEHTENPVAFLRALARQIGDTGKIALVCPRADIPNLELMFFDHLHSLTAAAIDNCARMAGLTIIGHKVSLPDVGDFQLFILVPTRSVDVNATVTAPFCKDLEQLAADRAIYLEAWTALDQTISDRVRGSRLVCFGATEAAALLRSYAPNSWTQIEELTVDEIGAAWRLEKPVICYDPNRWPKGQPMLLAVHPARQQAVAERLASDGFEPIAWPQTLAR